MLTLRVEKIVGSPEKPQYQGPMWACGPQHSKTVAPQNH